MGASVIGCGSAELPLGHARPIPTFDAETTTPPPPPIDADPISQTPTTQPSFQHNHASTQAAAEDLVRAHGYSPIPNQAYSADGLRALIGTRTGAADSPDQHAFFFHDGTFLGADTAQPSAGIAVAQTDPDTVRLSYTLYNAADPQSVPTAGAANVRFHWAGDHLVPLDPIPPFDFGVDGSRR